MVFLNFDEHSMFNQLNYKDYRNWNDNSNEMQVNIRTIDEAVVIGAALSMSSSAFVLQVGHMETMYNNGV
jgi:hypothetical protein